MNDKLSELCKTLSDLCNVPLEFPEALYCQKKEQRKPDDITVKTLYEAVIENVRPSLIKEKESFLLEDTLVEGFDREQHYQQVALVSIESLPLFIPTIAFSETQVSKIKFPICPKEGLKEECPEAKSSKISGSEEITAEKDDARKGSEEEEKEDSDEGEPDDDAIWDEEEATKKLRALSDSEEELNDQDDLSDEEESLDMDGEGDLPESIGQPSSLGDFEDWDQVEGEDRPEDDTAEDHDKQNEKPLPMSSFEKSSLRLAKEIERLEEKQIAEKPWQLKGDVDASKRPVNSLLQEVLEYDITKRPPPVITEEVTHSLEDIILKRIRDQVFDDVERKIKPVEAPKELRKKITLDQEKSKLSLAEVYEQEYIKQKSDAQAGVTAAVPTTAVTEELTDNEKMINKRMTNLFRQLDCLSNFHYTPLPRTAEVEIVANLPAVNVEEVGQEALTSANLLTADEVAGKFKRDIKGSTEKSKTDKKRERRKKKLHQATKFKKLKAVEAVKTVQPSKGKSNIRLADPALKSSAHFFNQLETQAKKHIHSSKRPAEEESNSKKVKAKKFKM